MRFSIALVESFLQQLGFDLLRYHCGCLRTHTSLPSRRFFSPGATTENMTAFASYCHRGRCRKVLSKDECMLRTRPVNDLKT